MADTNQPSGQTASTLSHAAGDLKNRAQDAAQAAKQNIQQGAQDVIHRAGEVASDLGKRASETLSSAASTAQDLASKVGERAEGAVATVGERMHSLGSTVRERGPRGGVLGSATSAVASGLETSGDYLQEQGLSGMFEDLQSVVRRYPVQALLVAVGVGFLMARALKRE